jgi:hypothetical protein
MGPTPEEKLLAAEKAENERLAKLKRERLAQLERERLEQARLAQLERERLEQERLAAIERERLAALEMERVRVVAGRELLAKKRIELIAAEKEYQRRIEYWNREGNYLYKYQGCGAEWTKVEKQSYVVRDLKYEVQVLENTWGK